MTHEIVSYHTDYLLNRILKVFDTALLRIPDERLDFRPNPETMSAKELGYHVYQVVFLLVRAIETGRQDAADLRLIEIDPSRLTKASEIVEYGEQVKQYVKRVVPTLSESDLQRTITKSTRTSGFETFMLAFEEAIHHRGQLMTYLRLIGVEPPYLYDYS